MILVGLSDIIKKSIKLLLVGGELLMPKIGKLTLSSIKLNIRPKMGHAKIAKSTQESTKRTNRSNNNLSSK